MRGRVFEKVGVNVSTVHGEFSPEFRKQIPGAEAGPAVLRHRHLPGGAPAQPARAGGAYEHPLPRDHARHWFGGGGDLTPMPIDAPELLADAARFHAAFKAACDRHDPELLPALQDSGATSISSCRTAARPRGLGGIFFDYLGDRTPGHGIEADFAFVQDVGRAFLDGYPAIVRRPDARALDRGGAASTSWSGAAATSSSTCSTTAARCSA